MATGLIVYAIAAAVAFHFLNGTGAEYGAAWGAAGSAVAGYAVFALLSIPAGLYSLVASAPENQLDTRAARVARWLVLIAAVLPYYAYRMLF
jgi:hypothetical protein